MYPNSIFLMCGASGSGKSWKVRQLEQLFTARSISNGSVSADRYFSPPATTFNHKPIYGWNPAFLHDAHTFCQRQFQMLIDAKVNVIIVDNTNCSISSVDTYTKIGDKYGYQARLVEPDTDWRYNDVECHCRSSHNVPLGSIQNMIVGVKKLKQDYQQLFGDSDVDAAFF